MANPYYAFNDPFIPFTRVKAEPVNNQFNAIVAAFDLLPPNAGAINTGTPTLGIDVGTGNAYVITMPSTRMSNTDGDEVVFRATHQNSGPATIQIDGIAAVPLRRYEGTALVAADILVDTFYTARFNAALGFYLIVSPALQTVAGAISYAAPTTTVKLVAGAGAATTVLRSDAQLVLDQGIAPVMTGVWTFSNTVNFDGAVDFDGAANFDGIVDFNAAVDFDGTVVFDNTVAVNGLLNVAGVVTFSNVVNFDAATDFDAAAVFDSTVDINGALTVDGSNTFSVAPTITAAGTVANPSLLLSSTLPRFELNDTDSAADAKSWQLIANTGVLELNAVNDANSVVNNVMTVTRSGATPDVFTVFGNTFSIVATALSSAATATWSGPHSFTRTFSSGNAGAVTLSAAAPLWEIDESGAAANNRRWWQRASSEQLLFQVANDARTSSTTWLAVDRTANVVDSIAFTGTDMTFNGRITLSKVTTSGTQVPLLLASTLPRYSMQQTNGAVDNRVWTFTVATEQLLFSVENDAATVSTSYMTVDRTGTTIDRVAFPTGNGASAPTFVVGSTLSAVLSNTTAHFVTDGNGGSGAALVLQGNAIPVSSPLRIAQNTGAAGTIGLVNFGVGNGAATALTASVGTINYNTGTGLTNYNTTSDERQKKNIRDSVAASSLLRSLQVRAFDWKDTKLGGLRWWFVAQELQRVMPEAVSVPNDPEATWAVDPSKLIPLMVKAMQELIDEVADLRATNAVRIKN